jgi:hypothetical protein
MLLTISGNVIACSSRRSPVSRALSRGRSQCLPCLLASVIGDLAQTFGPELLPNGPATDELCRPGTEFTKISESGDTHAEALSLSSLRRVFGCSRRRERSFPLMRFGTRRNRSSCAAVQAGIAGMYDHGSWEP